MALKVEHVLRHYGPAAAPPPASWWADTVAVVVAAAVLAVLLFVAAGTGHHRTTPIPARPRPAVSPAVPGHPGLRTTWATVEVGR